MNNGLLLREVLPSLDLIFITNLCVVYNATCNHLQNINPNDYVVIEFCHDGVVNFIAGFGNQERDELRTSYNNPSVKDLYDYVSSSYKFAQTS
jgi:hypothetical protein